MKYTLDDLKFQSSFELTSYITKNLSSSVQLQQVSKLFRAYELYNTNPEGEKIYLILVSKLFRAYELYNMEEEAMACTYIDEVSKLFRAYELYNDYDPKANIVMAKYSFKALSSLRVI